MIVNTVGTIQRMSIEHVNQMGKAYDIGTKMTITGSAFEPEVW